MRPYLITAKLMRPSNMKRFPTPALVIHKKYHINNIISSRPTYNYIHDTIAMNTAYLTPTSPVLFMEKKLSEDPDAS
jgi:hypothetical protein